MNQLFTKNPAQKLKLRKRPGRAPLCLANCCDMWLAAQRAGLKESSYVKYAAVISGRIKPRLGLCRPETLSQQHIHDFRDRLLYRDGLSPKTVKDTLIILKSVLSFASRQLDFNPPPIVYPRLERREMRVLSAEEQDRLVKLLLGQGDECSFAVLLALQTGLRIGELCALRWENLSWREETVRVCATMQRLKAPEGQEPRTRIVISSPKSRSSARLIPLGNEMAELCRRMDPGLPSAFVLTGSESFMEPRTLQYRLKKYAAQAQIESLNFHALRHSFATRCVEAGFDAKSLSEILGHSGTSITLDRYVHASMELKRSNMKKLREFGIF